VDKPELAERLQDAIEKTLQVDKVRTGDLSGTASTADFAGAVIKRLAA
jgi:isocitrate dehydrogenase (NAD+)